MSKDSELLNPEKALIFRITHRDHVRWILENGMHARNGARSDPSFRTIGSRDLIRKRTDHPAPAGPGGTLIDYVPFDFTPFSMLLHNVRTGYGGNTDPKKERQTNCAILTIGGKSMEFASRANPGYCKGMVDLKLQVPVTDKVQVDAETLAAIDRGIKDAGEGRTVSIDDVRKMIPKWISKFESQKPR